MRFLFIILFFSFKLQAQITYFGSASTPTDNSTNTATTTAVTPPGSMTTGDLVVLISYQRGISTTHSISATGGQTWNTLLENTGAASATLSAAVFWCRYNGTWTTDPSVVFSVGTNTNVVMHVFRPTNSTKVWAVESTPAFVPYSAPSTPFDIAGASTFFFGSSSVNASMVALYGAMSDDDNTWSVSTANSYTIAGTAQYRNTSGSDVSSATTYLIRTTTGNWNGPVLRQATLGGDPGLYWYGFIYESDPPAGPTRRVIIIQ
jgi:hypothetical protein